jgi:hypothetical protein
MNASLHLHCVQSEVGGELLNIIDFKSFKRKTSQQGHASLLTGRNNAFTQSTETFLFALLSPIAKASASNIPSHPATSIQLRRQTRSLSN